MRFAFFCGLVAALLCLTQNANAQYARKGADLVSQNGFTLSDPEIISIVGNDVFDQTVIGARKQYKAGKGLITGGVLGICAGLAGAVYTGYKAGKAGYNDLTTAVGDDASIAALYLGSTALTSAGGAEVSSSRPSARSASTGLPRKSIGFPATSPSMSALRRTASVLR